MLCISKDFLFSLVKSCFVEWKNTIIFVFWYLLGGLSTAPGCPEVWNIILSLWLYLLSAKMCTSGKILPVFVETFKSSLPLESGSITYFTDESSSFLLLTLAASLVKTILVTWVRQVSLCEKKKLPIRQHGKWCLLIGQSRWGSGYGYSKAALDAEKRRIGIDDWQKRQRKTW